MAGVARHHSVTEIERGSSDEQIVERDLHSPGLLLAINSSSQQASVTGKGIDWNIRQQFPDKELPAYPPLRRVGPVDAVGQPGRSSADRGWPVLGVHRGKAAAH